MLMKMPVLRKRDDVTELIELDLSDVLYIHIENRNIVYHTADEKYYQITRLSELEEHLSDKGFDLLDKTNLVNLNKVQYFDEKYGKIYFQPTPGPNSKYASVAAIQKKWRGSAISRAIAKNTNNHMQYKIKKEINVNKQTHTLKPESPR